jgi:hypothetical protein
MNVCFQYDFHPVGQGLFASGCLYESNKPQPRFVWVYDCGTLPSDPPLDWNVKMQQLHQFIRGKTSIDLLTLSHFDDDHIAGVTALLARFRVETLMLPYVPLWERLLIPFQKGIEPGNRLMEYFLNPIAFLREIGGNNLGRIIEVEPGEEDGPAFESEGGDFPREPDLGDAPWKLKAKTKLQDVEEKSGADADKNVTQKETLASGQPLTVQGLWEFCPYNAKRRDERTPDFRAMVEELRDKLLNTVNAADRDAALANLKATYDGEFLGNERQRNIISLFLYAGPVYPTWQEYKIVSPFLTSPPFYPGRYPCYYRVHPHAPGHTQKCSILYTGDGYLNTSKCFNSLNSSLGANRMPNLGVVQVAHHGSRTNWHLGLAAKLNPVFSVFSSDPMRGNTYHPHAEVLRDFWPHSPIQVNDSGASYCGWLLR